METNTAKRVLTFERVRDAMADSLGIESLDISPDSRLRDLGDSMDIAQLVLDLEEDFDADIPDDELGKLFTAQDVLNYLNDPRSH